jgi:hypothetical protein
MLVRAEGDPVMLRLSPEHTHRLAETLRLQLALELEHTDIGTVPVRQELERTRQLLDHYCGRLDMLRWGEASAEVEACFARDELNALVEDLQLSARECRAIGADDDGTALERTALVVVDALDRHGRSRQPVVTT